MAGHSRVVVLTTATLALIVFVRRAQGQAGDSLEWRHVLARVLRDTDVKSDRIEEKAAGRPAR